MHKSYAVSSTGEGEKEKKMDPFNVYLLSPVISTTDAILITITKCFTEKYCACVS